MKIVNLNEDDVVAAAKQKFPEDVICLDTCDLFLPDIEKGDIQIEGIEHVIHVSTHYAYEDRMVNGNKTRYKLAITTINRKKDFYEVIYDSMGRCFVAYGEHDVISFVPYEDFYELLKPYIHRIDAES